MEVIDKYNGCELVKEDGKFSFFYPDGDIGFVRQLISCGDSPQEDIFYYQIDKESGTDIKLVFRDHIRSAV